MPPAIFRRWHIFMMSENNPNCSFGNNLGCTMTSMPAKKRITYVLLKYNYYFKGFADHQVIFWRFYTASILHRRVSVCRYLLNLGVSIFPLRQNPNPHRQIPRQVFAYQSSKRKNYTAVHRRLI